MAGQWRKGMLPIGSAAIRSALGKRLSEGAFSALPPLPLSDGGQMAEADSLLPSGASGRWRNSVVGKKWTATRAAARARR
jgi:hypothetical protein